MPPLRFPEFSGEWNRTSIGDKFELYSGNTPSRLEKDQFVGKINWITSGELKNHYIAATNETITEEAAANNNLRLLPIGTFVIAIYGLEAAGVRSTGSITTEASTISQACMAFLPKGEISNEFLYSWYMKHGNIIGLRYAQGTKQQNLSYDIIERFKISYPNVLEQRKLEKFISLLDRRIAVQSGLIEDLQKLKAALYQKVFSSIPGEEVALSNLAKIIKGKQINGTELFDSGNYYVMNGGTLPSGFYNEYNTPANTISISEGGNSCGYVQFNNVPFWSGGHCYTLQITSKQIHLSYLYHYLKHREQVIMALRIGSGLPNIQKKDLERFPILMPTIEVQQRLSRIFDSLQRKEEVEKSILNRCLSQKLYLLQKMFI